MIKKYQAEISKIKSAFITEQEEIIAELESRNKLSTADVMKNYEDKIEELLKQHKEKIDNINKTNERNIKKINYEHEGDIKLKNDEIEMLKQTLEEELKAKDEFIEKLTTEKDTIIQNHLRKIDYLNTTIIEKDDNYRVLNEKKESLQSRIDGMEAEVEAAKVAIEKVRSEYGMLTMKLEKEFNQKNVSILSLFKYIIYDY